jgi:hypothetical protein
VTTETETGTSCRRSSRLLAVTVMVCTVASSSVAAAAADAAGWTGGAVWAMTACVSTLNTKPPANVACRCFKFVSCEDVDPVGDLRASGFLLLKRNFTP